jgi:hypothetical protein
MTYMLPHHENERQQRVNHIWFRIFGNQGIACIHTLITELLTTFLGQNTTYKWKNTDSKIINITNCEACKNSLLATEYLSLIIYYYQTAKT